MSIWQKITAAAKFLFGGFEAATDYILGILNGWMTKENIAKNVQKVHSGAVLVYALMTKYSKWCPPFWECYWESIYGVVGKIKDTLEDGQISTAEIDELVALWKTEYAKWMSTDEEAAADETTDGLEGAK